MMAFFDTTVHGSSDFKLFGNIHVDIHLGIRTLESSITAYGSLLVYMGDIDIIIGFVGTSRKVSADIRLWCSDPDVVTPVKSLVAFFRPCHPFVVFFFVIPAFTCRHTFPCFCSRISLYVCFGVGRVNKTGIVLPTVIGIDRNCVLAIALSFFCRYHYYAVCCTHTINGCRCIFQDRNIVDVVEVHVVELSFIGNNTIDNEQRCTHVTNL